MSGPLGTFNSSTLLQTTSTCQAASLCLVNVQMLLSSSSTCYWFTSLALLPSHHYHVECTSAATITSFWLKTLSVWSRATTDQGARCTGHPVYEHEKANFPQSTADNGKRCRAAIWQSLALPVNLRCWLCNVQFKQRKVCEWGMRRVIFPHGPSVFENVCQLRKTIWQALH